VEFLPDSGHAVRRESGETMSGRPRRNHTPAVQGEKGACPEIAVMAGEQRSGVIRQAWGINRGTGRNPARPASLMTFPRP
jgi:hypothetical protein